MPRVPSAAAAHIGERIVRARQGRKMTQDQLAVLTGIDSSNIRSYEGGRATPSIHTLVRIAVALDVEAGSLIEGLTLAHFAPARSRRAG